MKLVKLVAPVLFVSATAVGAIAQQPTSYMPVDIKETFAQIRPGWSATKRRSRRARPIS